MRVGFSGNGVSVGVRVGARVDVGMGLVVADGRGVLLGVLVGVDDSTAVHAGVSVGNDSGVTVNVTVTLGTGDDIAMIPVGRSRRGKSAAAAKQIIPRKTTDPATQ